MKRMGWLFFACLLLGCKAQDAFRAAEIVPGEGLDNAETIWTDVSDDGLALYYTRYETLIDTLVPVIHHYE